VLITFGAITRTFGFRCFDGPSATAEKRSGRPQIAKWAKVFIRVGFVGPRPALPARGGSDESRSVAVERGRALSQGANVELVGGGRATRESRGIRLLMRADRHGLENSPATMTNERARGRRRRFRFVAVIMSVGDLGPPRGLVWFRVYRRSALSVGGRGGGPWMVSPGEAHSSRAESRSDVGRPAVWFGAVGPKYDWWRGAASSKRGLG